MRILGTASVHDRNAAGEKCQWVVKKAIRTISALPLNTLCCLRARINVYHMDFIKLQDDLVWKRSSRSPHLTINLTYQVPSVNYVP